MRPVPGVALLTLASTALIGTSAPEKPDFPGAQIFTVQLSGQAEVSGTVAPALSGDMDGSGQVMLTVDLAQRQICYDFTLSDLATPLMAHIHKAPALSNGPSVVTLFTGPGVDLKKCVTWTEKWLTEIVAHPANFYVNLYTTEYPDGALRGQLMG